jgi:hypothetical protein
MTLANLGPVPLDFALHEISPTLNIQAIKPQDLNGKHILYDLYHGEPPSSEYSILIGDLASAGAQVIGNVMPIDASVLEGFDVLWVNCCGDTSWTTEELSSVAD